MQNINPPWATRTRHLAAPRRRPKYALAPLSPTAVRFLSVTSRRLSLTPANSVRPPSFMLTLRDLICLHQGEEGFGGCSPRGKVLRGCIPHVLLYITAARNAYVCISRISVAAAAISAHFSLYQIISYTPALIPSAPSTPLLAVRCFQLHHEPAWLRCHFDI